MRTNVDLPSELTRAARTPSAEPGDRPRGRVQLPFIVGAGERVNPSSGDLARALADADAAAMTDRPGRRALRSARRRG